MDAAATSLLLQRDCHPGCNIGCPRFPEIIRLRSLSGSSGFPGELFFRNRRKTIPCPKFIQSIAGQSLTYEHTEKRNQTQPAEYQWIVDVVTISLTDVESLVQVFFRLRSGIRSRFPVPNPESPQSPDQLALPKDQH